MKIRLSQLRYIIKEEVQRALVEAPAARAPRGFLRVELEGDPELDEAVIAIAAHLGKNVRSLKSCTTEDDGGAYDRYVAKVQNLSPVEIPGVFGECSSGELLGQPVVVCNEGGMGSIFM